MTTAKWITIGLLAPFWWGVGLLVLALLGDAFPRWHARASRLFAWLEGVRFEPPPPRSTAFPDRFAA